MRLSDDKILIATLVLSLAVIFPDSPAWVSVFTIVMILFRWCSDMFSWVKLSRWMTSVLAIALFGLVIFQYRSFMSQEASTSLLMGLTALKIVDFSTQRDRQILILLGFLMVSLKPLYNFDFYWLAPLIICMAGLWWSLLSPSQPRAGRFLFFLFMQSIPAAVLLFFVFPRVVMPWATAKSSERGIVGFSDRLVPGKIAELTEVDRMVFRAEFSTPQRIQVQDLYWRGIVLNRSQGLHWFSEQNSAPSIQEAPEGGVSYRMIQEEEFPGFLFGLETPLDLHSQAIETRAFKNFVYKSLSDKKSSISYTVRSDITYKNTELPQDNERQVPKLTPLILTWVDRIKSENSSTEARLAALKNFFSKSGFAYTRQPGSYADDGLEDFLFRRRRGFCEHFAGSYGTLARALGIPSRVIVGFQGGIYNTMGEFWKIGTLDAHSWVEIYNNGEWQRVDPSSWIAPLRIKLGAYEFFNLSIEEQQFLEDLGLGQKKWSWFVATWFSIQFFYDNLNYRWTSFIIDFDLTAQRDLLKDIKPGSRWLFLLFASIVVISILLLRVGPIKKRSQPSLKKLFSKIEKLAAKKKLVRANGETPLRYLARLQKELASENEFLSNFSAVYDRQIYRQEEDSSEVRTLNREWKKFKKSIRVSANGASRTH